MIRAFVAALLGTDHAIGAIDLHAFTSARWLEIAEWNARECDPRQAVIVSRRIVSAEELRSEAFWRAVDTQSSRLRIVRSA